MQQERFSLLTEQLYKTLTNSPKFHVSVMRMNIYEPLKFKFGVFYIDFVKFYGLLVILHLHTHFLEHCPTFSVLLWALGGNPYRGHHWVRPPCWLVSRWFQPLSDHPEARRQRRERTGSLFPAMSCSLDAARTLHNWRCL